MWKAIKAWYLKVCLPYEDPSHPLNTKDEGLKSELEELIDEYFEVNDETD